MYSTEIIFYIALLGIIGMILLKRSELKNGKKYFLARLGDRTDHIVHDAYARVRFVLSHINKHNAIALAQWLAFHVLSFFQKVYLRLHALAHSHPHSKKVIDMVTGKGELKRTSGASFYLKQIAAEHGRLGTVSTAGSTKK